MVIKTLVENMVIPNSNLKGQHGLSLYIKTIKHKLLFDVGADDLFIKNAQEMGIDLSKVDTLIISHGHYDHGGGIHSFLKINSQAKIYIHEQAFRPHLFKIKEGDYLDIGISQELLYHPQVILCKGNYKIDEELEVISLIEGSDLVSKANLVLLSKDKEVIQSDNFEHEQSLLIQLKKESLLITGCSHRGIVNIVEQVMKDKSIQLNYVIGGFHLYNPGNKVSEPQIFVEEVGRRLLSTGTKYFTCHCTGLEAYEHLKKMMGDKLDYLATGSEIEIV